MELTKEKAIEEHRKMWNWIADKLLEPETQEKQKNVHVLKRDYCRKNHLNILHACWCCEYDWQYVHIYKRCSNCPLEWGTEDEWDGYYCECINESGLWLIANNLAGNRKYKEASEIARQIANLSEK